MSAIARPAKSRMSYRANPRALPGPLVLAIWFGLVAGLAEAALFVIRKLLLHTALHTAPDVVWMAPIANVLLFLVLGLSFWLWTHSFHKQLKWQVLFGVYACLTSTALLLNFDRLHKGAALLLAVGLAVQATRVASRQLDHVGRVIRSTLPWLCALVAALGVGLHTWRLVREQRAVGLLPPIQAPVPNVLLLILDTVRAQNLSLYSYSRQTTPFLEQYAKQGVRFDLAIAPSSWTLPSHGTMFSGRWPHELSAGWKKPLDDEYQTIAEALQKQGYRTGGFVANLIYGQAAFGLNRGFSHYEDYSRSIGEFILSASIPQRISHTPFIRRLIHHYDVLGRKPASGINDRFLQWLDRSPDRPFFAFLNYMDAHEPYLPPSPFDTLFGPIDENRYRFFRFWQHEGSRVGKTHMTPQEIQSEVNAYDGAIATLDNQVQALIEALRRRQALQNTLVVVTSDHGEHFGEHGVFTHGSHVYMETQHVPLIIIFPGHVPEATVVTHPVSLRSLPSTIMALIDPARAITFEGANLTSLWATPSEPPLSEPILSEVREPQLEGTSNPGNYSRSLVTGSYQFIRSADGSEVLYDLQSAEQDLRNVIDSTDLQGPVTSLRNELNSLERRTGSTD